FDQLGAGLLLLWSLLVLGARVRSNPVAVIVIATNGLLLAFLSQGRRSDDPETLERRRRTAGAGDRSRRDRPTGPDRPQKQLGYWSDGRVRRYRYCPIRNCASFWTATMSTGRVVGARMAPIYVPWW